MVAIVLAVAKPWAHPVPPVAPVARATTPAAPEAPSSASSGVPGGTAVAGQDSNPTDLTTRECVPGMGWRLYAADSSEGRPLRTWYEVDPAHATGPDDPGIPRLRIYAVHLVELGFCAGADPSGRRPIARIGLWQSGTAAMTPIVPVRLFDESASDPNAGARFAPPGTPSTVPGGAWAPGRYIFAVAYRVPTEETWWFSVDVVGVPLEPAPSPLASPLAGRGDDPA